MFSRLFVLTFMLASAFATQLQLQADEGSGDAVFMYRPAVMNETPAPGVPGDRFKAKGIGYTSLNNHGMAAFWAQLQNDGDDRIYVGIFLWTGDSVVSIARFGTPAPLPGYYFRLDDPMARYVAINDAGTIVFSADILPDPSQFYSNVRRGVFVYENGTLKCLSLFDHSPAVSINNRGEVLAGTFDALWLFTANGPKRIVSQGQAVPGIAGASFTYFSNTGMNDRSEIAFSAHYESETGANDALFLISGGEIKLIAKRGDTFPEIPDAGVEPNYFRGPDESGSVVFGVWRTAQEYGGSVHLPGGIYRYSGGSVAPIIYHGQELSGRVVNWLDFGPLGPSGDLAIYAWFQGDPHAIWRGYIARGGSISPLVFFAEDGRPSDFGDPGVRSINANDEMIFGIDRGIYFAHPVEPDVIYADDFDTLGANGRPLHWSTAWTNSGIGESLLYDSGGGDSFGGCCTLRMQVAVGGGATFALSDPIPAQPNHLYRLTAQIRSARSNVFFSVIQFDGSGKGVGFVETVLPYGGWQWDPESLLIVTSSETASIRIRFGMIADVESYADVDQLR